MATFCTLTDVLSQFLNLFLHLFAPVCRTFVGVHQHDVSGSQPCGEKLLGVCPRSLGHCGPLHLHQRLPEPRAAGQSSAAASLAPSAAAGSLTSLLLLLLLLFLLQDLVISLILPDWLRTSSFFLRWLASVGPIVKAGGGKKD